MSAYISFSLVFWLLTFQKFRLLCFSTTTGEGTNGQSFFSLLTMFPMLYFTSLWLCCDYQFVLLNPFTFFTHPSP